MVTKEYVIGNAIICITRPELSEKERAMREKRIQIALQQFGRAMHENAQPAEV